ncbi:hypothetical protein DGM85_15465 [Xanthomonas phaseoli pv. phaseoli]|uniref:Secreted protein n=1 Tax=Xanthomonas campestris pv. phaseoli TaxID=317013 RepID=A0AB38E648_XANCH|nr:hypothetical protein DGM93_15225 [Xanthomonas phaseoli pv. phaseoli]QWN29694.1 hypothetical protein DGM85_15465 [Xanthomonas phaseoli pv. phaseoli]QWN33796.1 hypothetical protein DGM81_14985 [Xanthomonas phaseoli pv. phaseoli]SON89633.1 conserved exported hypothetical protein [Xanthomonas phaseoli pv. phaseoli]SON91484.1 conserved exported hypothetical protein [Xanthomonas phaseoli pv. phaseoli]
MLTNNEELSMLRKSIICARIASFLAATAFGFLLLSISTTSQADDLGAVSVLGNIQPANPTDNQVRSAHQQQALGKCKQQFVNSSSAYLASWAVTAGGKHPDYWNINSVWICTSR